MKEHIPVLLEEVIEGLNLKANYNCVDATLGGGGHALKILENIKPKGKVIGFDWDGEAIKIAQVKLKKDLNRVIFINKNYDNLEESIENLDTKTPINAILIDLGLSMYQLQERERAFSFNGVGKLDMRYDRESAGVNAHEIINSFGEEKIANIIYEYGEERLSRVIAREILKRRNESEIKTAEELAEVVREVYKRHYRKKSNTDPATKTFQALRIFINSEFENIEKFLPQALNVLEKGGRMAAITYHSLEDKIIKKYFKKESRDCLCPPEIPECRCGHEARIKLINRSVIIPSEDEIKNNPAARSAKLRIIEKI